MMLLYLLLLSVVPVVQSSLLRRWGNNSNAIGTNETLLRRWGGSSSATSTNHTDGQTKALPSLVTYYDSHFAGKGIWKWNCALVAYQWYFSFYEARLVQLQASGGYFKIAEIGVQSGGSLDMWKAVLGPSSYAYGLDINPAAQKFADARTTIVVGDQGDGNMWLHFWTHVTTTVDVLIDDGSHEAHHMSMALHQAFPHLNPGGFVAIEDIHGQHYTQDFYWPAANSIHNWQAQGLVESVSLWPFLLVVKRVWSPGVMSQLPIADVTVTSFAEMWAALPSNPGKIVMLQNSAWGAFLSQPTLFNIFQQFPDLNAYQMSDYPVGCHSTTNPVCTVSITNSNAQAQISAVEIFPTALVVHVPFGAPVIQAVRKGTDWIPY
jgi:hypothetical protein